MHQRISFVTLGVRDLELMKRWYCHKLGWIPMKHDANICYFKLNGIVLALFHFSRLAEDIGVTDDNSGFKPFAFAINLNSREEVDRSVDDLRSQGVHIVREPQFTLWGGYRAYIADPEDNYWELVYNPKLKMDADGNII